MRFRQAQRELPFSTAGILSAIFFCLTAGLAAEEKQADAQFVDYAGKLDQEHAAGVTSDNNAVVLLIQAFGPDILFQDTAYRREYFRRLGTEMPPVHGDYLKTAKSVYGEETDELKEFYEQLNRATESPGSDDDYPDVSKWLADNAGPLKLVAAASRKPRYYEPIMPEGDLGVYLLGAEIVRLSRETMWMYAARVSFHIHAGRMDDALADSETVHRLSRLIAQHPILIHQLVAHALTASARLIDDRIVRSGRLTAEQARRHQLMLESLPAFPPMKSIVDHGERFASLDALQRALDTPGEAAKLKMLRAKVDTAFDDFVEALQLDDRTEQQARFAQIRQRFSGLIRLKDGEEIPLDELLPTVERMPGLELRTKASLAITTAGYALAEYHAEHGEYPSDLETLIPKYLKEIPRDFQGEGAFKYLPQPDADRFLLYGVGENGKDDGGKRDEDGRDDLTFGSITK